MSLGLLRTTDGRSRRKPPVADRGLGRLNWAGKRTYRGRQRRRDVPPKPEFVAMRFNDWSRRQGVVAIAGETRSASKARALRTSDVVSSALDRGKDRLR